MITKIKRTAYRSKDGGPMETGSIYTVFCLESDEKPLDLPNASTLIEMDTGKAYAFDESGKAWMELGAASIVV